MAIGALILLVVLYKLLRPMSDIKRSRKPRPATGSDPQFSVGTGIFNDEQSLKTGVFTEDVSSPAATQIFTSEHENEAAALVIISPDDFGKTYIVRPGAGRIGLKKRENDIFFNYNGVSRKHAVIDFSEGSWTIQDLKSTNGTYVNRSPVTAISLNDRDIIEIGRTVAMFRVVLTERAAES